MGVWCRKLLSPPAKPKRKIEFIGNSITCGTGADQSVIPCGTAVAGSTQCLPRLWTGDGPEPECTISSVGRVGDRAHAQLLQPGYYHARVFDKISMRNDTIEWDFAVTSRMWSQYAWVRMMAFRFGSFVITFCRIQETLSSLTILSPARWQMPGFCVYEIQPPCGGGCLRWGETEGERYFFPNNGA